MNSAFQVVSEIHRACQSCSGGQVALIVNGHACALDPPFNCALIDLFDEVRHERPEFIRLITEEDILENKHRLGKPANDVVSEIKSRMETPPEKTKKKKGECPDTL